MRFFFGALREERCAEKKAQPSLFGDEKKGGQHESSRRAFINSAL